jgi:hypothetical protein
MQYKGQNKDNKKWLWRARAAHSPTCWYPVEDYSMSQHRRYKSEQRIIKEVFYLLLMFWAHVVLTSHTYFISSITKIYHFTSWHGPLYFQQEFSFHKLYLLPSFHPYSLLTPFVHSLCENTVHVKVGQDTKSEYFLTECTPHTHIRSYA